MKAFFDSLDAKVAAFFKAKFGKKAKPAATPSLDDLAESGTPIFLMVGSLTDCSMKDAVAYARGLAESYITAPEIAYIRVLDDRQHGRYLYELQEGGPGFSIAENLLEQLDAGQKVLVQLTNGAHAAIEEVHGEVISLVYPAAPDAVPVQNLVDDAPEPEANRLWSAAELCGPVALSELYPQNKKLLKFGEILLGIAVSLFLLTGGIYVVSHSGLLAGDAMLSLTKAGVVTEAADNPVWQLDKARSAATGDQIVRVLKKDSNGWSWELGK